MEIPPADTARLAGGRLTIDLGALAANWRTLAAGVGRVTTAAVVKGDGYGTGLEPAGKALADAGCTTFFVARPQEGLRLRAVLPEAVIYVLDGLLLGAADLYGRADLRPALASRPEVEEWLAFRASGGATGAAVHVDTGMNRLGLPVADARQLLQRADFASLGATLLMSHLACADTPDHPLNQKQLAAFRALRDLAPAIPASLANSAGILLGPDYHFDLVRPGIALYGGAVAKDGRGRLAPVVRLEGRVLQIRHAKAGETVGYGATETLKRDSRLAILGVGYADGYHRLAGSSDGLRGARVFLSGGHAPLVGRVSMDLVAVDVTDLPDVQRDDWAELFGPNVAVDDVAAHAGTIGYELLTALGRRYERHYLPA